jgi:hypothetical protein
MVQVFGEIEAFLVTLGRLALIRTTRGEQVDCGSLDRFVAVAKQTPIQEQALEGLQIPVQNAVQMHLLLVLRNYVLSMAWTATCAQ